MPRIDYADCYYGIDAKKWAQVETEAARLRHQAPDLTKNEAAVRAAATVFRDEPAQGPMPENMRWWTELPWSQHGTSWDGYGYRWNLIDERLSDGTPIRVLSRGRLSGA